MYMKRTPGEHLPTTLSLHKFSKHLLGINGDKNSPAARQDFFFFVEDFRHVDVLPSVHADFPALDAQRLVKRHGLEILNRHFLGKGDNVAQLVHLPHGIVENRGDDAAVAVTGRTGVTLAQPEVADEHLPLFVEGELEPHAVAIILAAGEAIVFLQLVVCGFVAVDFAGHAEDSIAKRPRNCIQSPMQLQPYPSCNFVSLVVDNLQAPSSQKSFASITPILYTYRFPKLAPLPSSMR